MAQILCAISGIDFNVQYMPMSLTSRESHHPIFDIPTSKLLQLTPRWLKGELNDTENYLLYLALFNSTGLMQFRVPAIRTSNTASIIAQNMIPLTAIVELIASSGSSKVTEILHLPAFAITPDTNDLASSPEWVQIWDNCYKDYQDNYRTSTALEKLERKELVLERYIKDITKDISSYAVRLADWAADAGKFSQYGNFIITNEHHKPETLQDYWRRIIVACAKTEQVWSLDAADLQELIEHLEEHLNHGSIFAHTVLSLLRSGQNRKQSFDSIGDIDIGTNGAPIFRILNADTSVEDANKLALIDSAPATPPVEKNYPNKLAYIRAKLNYQMAQQYKQDQADNATAIAARVDTIETSLNQNKNTGA